MHSFAFELLSTGGCEDESEDIVADFIVSFRFDGFNVRLHL